MWKKMLAAPFLGALFVVVLPVIGFVVVLGALGQLGLRLVMSTAERAQRWAELA